MFVSDAGLSVDARAAIGEHAERVLIASSRRRNGDGGPG